VGQVSRGTETAGAVGARLRSGPGGIASGLLVAQHGHGLRTRPRPDRVGLHRLRDRRRVPWLLVVGLAGHGFKDLWQHRRQFVANTRWWPPFCLVVDWVAATVIAVEIVGGVDFH
jgi:hypothetical protein